MKIVTIIGARPQFIKAATVSRAISRHNNSTNSSNSITEVLVHTGQHYDDNMSAVFFQELQIPKPDYFLDIHGLSHGAMTGQMMEKIESVLLEEKPNIALVYGDTNSTLAGALAAAKLHIPVAHVEAGLRSFNRCMPEELNRVLTDHVSELLFCPTNTAVSNLAKEGITRGVHLVGDVMFDAFLFYKDLASSKSKILSDLSLRPKGYCLATVHREENTSDIKRLESIFTSFEELAGSSCLFIVPIHPRTRIILEKTGIVETLSQHVLLIPPVSYLDMIMLEVHARVILTDSGGVQKEAYFAYIPCLTLREETEWIETLESGQNTLVGTDREKICSAFKQTISGNLEFTPDLFGDGHASEKIVAGLTA